MAMSTLRLDGGMLERGAEVTMTRVGDVTMQVADLNGFGLFRSELQSVTEAGPVSDRAGAENGWLAARGGWHATVIRSGRPPDFRMPALFRIRDRLVADYRSYLDINPVHE